MQGSALGLNGGLGNLGVSVMQLVVPIAISVQWFTSQSEGPHLQIYSLALFPGLE